MKNLALLYIVVPCWLFIHKVHIFNELMAYIPTFTLRISLVIICQYAVYFNIVDMCQRYFPFQWNEMCILLTKHIFQQDKLSSTILLTKDHPNSFWKFPKIKSLQHCHSPLHYSIPELRGSPPIVCTCSCNTIPRVVRTDAYSSAFFSLPTIVLNFSSW